MRMKAEKNPSLTLDAGTRARSGSGTVYLEDRLVWRAETNPPTRTPAPMIRSSGNGLVLPDEVGGIAAARGAGGGADSWVTKKCISLRVPAIGILLASTASTISRCGPGLRSVNVYSVSVVYSGSRSSRINSKLSVGGASGFSLYRTTTVSLSSFSPGSGESTSNKGAGGGDVTCTASGMA